MGVRVGSLLADGASVGLTAGGDDVGGGASVGLTAGGDDVGGGASVGLTAGGDDVGGGGVSGAGGGGGGVGDDVQAATNSPTAIVVATGSSKERIPCPPDGV